MSEIITVTRQQWERLENGSDDVPDGLARLVASRRSEDDEAPA